jgi:tight adherence protein B
VSAPTIIIAAGVLITLVTMAFAINSAMSVPQQRLRRRAGQVRTRHSAAKKLVVATAKTNLRLKEAQAIPFIEKLVKQFMPHQSELRDRLARTGYSVSTSTYVMASVVMAAAIGAALFVALPLPLIACAGIGIALGLMVPHMTVGYLGNRRRNRFMAILPDAIDLIVRGLRSGLPVTESISTAGREMPDPVGNEFRAVSDRVRLGAPLEEVLWQTARRLRTSEFNFFVISLSIQQETGGNLAETLANLSDILRKRRQMALKVKALSSEARAGAYILGILPFAVFGAMQLLNPEYPAVLFADPRGHMLLMLGAGMLTVGFVTIIKLVKFEI